MQGVSSWRGEAHYSWAHHAASHSHYHDTRSQHAPGSCHHMLSSVCMEGGRRVGEGIFLQVVLLLLTASVSGRMHLPPSTTHTHGPVLNMHHCIVTSTPDRWTVGQQATCWPATHRLPGFWGFVGRRSYVWHSLWPVPLHLPTTMTTNLNVGRINQKTFSVKMLCLCIYVFFCVSLSHSVSVSSVCVCICIYICFLYGRSLFSFPLMLSLSTSMLTFSSNPPLYHTHTQSHTCTLLQTVPMETHRQRTRRPLPGGLKQWDFPQGVSLLLILQHTEVCPLARSACTHTQKRKSVKINPHHNTVVFKNITTTMCWLKSYNSPLYFWAVIIVQACGVNFCGWHINWEKTSKLSKTKQYVSLYEIPENITAE